MLDSIWKGREIRNYLNILSTYLYNHIFFKKCKLKNNELFISYTQKLGIRKDNTRFSIQIHFKPKYQLFKVSF